MNEFTKYIGNIARGSKHAIVSLKMKKIRYYVDGLWPTELGSELSPLRVVILMPLNSKATSPHFLSTSMPKVWPLVVQMKSTYSSEVMTLCLPPCSTVDPTTHS